MRLSLRPYQEECLEHAKTKNTIVSLPTNKGKTLIAARLIEHYLKQCPDKRVAFLVPTRPLVDQQSGYCMKHCIMNNGKNPVVQKVFGDEQSGWQQKEWNDALERHQIFLGTPAIFQRALVTEKYIRVDHFSLFVFDECHNAKGNSFMAAILRDAIAPHVIAAGSTDAPRILGLTASIILGKVENMEQKRQALEILMNSTVICPDIASDYVEDKKFHRVDYLPQPSHDLLKDVIEMHVREALDNTRLMKNVERTVKHCSHVFSELGSTSMFYYIEEVIIQQIRTYAEILELYDDDNSKSAGLRMRACLPVLQDSLKKLLKDLSLCVPKTIEMSQTPKLKQLLELLDTNFTVHNSDGGYRGIIFVEQVALVSALAKQIDDAFSPRFRCGAIAGTKAQTETARQEQLEAFRDGQVQVLVATAALEEGIDVAECKFVVRYSDILTTKAHIQGSGRARHPEAEIYYFENCPENERRKEDAMMEVARNKSLALGTEDLQNANASMRNCIDGVHPYPFMTNRSNIEGEVNVFNCKQLLVTYCSRVLRKSISPEIELYDYFEDTTGSSGEKLSSIRYPTPDGWKKKVCSDYMSFWAGIDLSKDVFFSDRVKTKTLSEREEMCFVYLVVVELRENGLLDKHNKPIEPDSKEMWHKCPLRGEQPPRGYNLKDIVIQPKQTSIEQVSVPTEESMVDEESQSQSVYPFTGEDGEIQATLNSCKRVLNEHLQAVLPTIDVSSKKMYEYKEMGQRKTVSTLKVPSPTGWLYIRRSDYDEFYSKIDLRKITIPGKNLILREEAVFAYLAVVKLRERGYLNSRNKASVDAVSETRKHCNIETISSATNKANCEQRTTMSTSDGISVSAENEHLVHPTGKAPGANNEAFRPPTAPDSTFADADEDNPIVVTKDNALMDSTASPSRERPPVTEVVAGRQSPEPSELDACHMYVM